jgi:hypothetical protein
MIRMADVEEQVAVCASRMETIAEFPAECERLGIDPEAAITVIGSAAMSMGLTQEIGVDDLPDGMLDEMPDEMRAEAEAGHGRFAAPDMDALGNLACLFVLAVSLGRAPQVPDDAMPDWDNVTDEQD